MAMLVSLKTSGRAGDRTLEGTGRDKKISSGEELTYVVIADNATQNADYVMASAGLPKIGDKLNGRTCRNITATAQGAIRYRGVNTNLWEFKAKFDSPDQTDDDPTELDPEISWSTETYEEVMTKDANGVAVKTACGEPILLTVPRVCPVATITYYKPASYEIAASNVGCVNSGAFMGWPAKSALLKNIGIGYETKTVKDEEVTFAKVTVTIVFKDDGSDNPWRAKVLHQGRKCKDPVTNEIKVWMDKEGNTGLVNLDQNGHALENGEEEQYLEFDIYKAVSFSGLGL